MAVSVAVCEIFSIKEWCELENRVKVRSRSLEMGFRSAIAKSAGHMQNRKTKTSKTSPDPNRYRRRCPDPNARIQKFIHYMAIATFAIAALCDSGLSPV